MVATRRTRILLVEDDPDDARFFREAFQEAGLDVDVEHLTSLAAARERAPLGDYPDLVVLDVHLGDGTGIDVLRMLRAEPGWDKLPIAMLTGSQDPGDIAGARSARATTYYLKPKSFQEYVALAADLQVIWAEGGLAGASPHA